MWGSKVQGRSAKLKVGSIAAAVVLVLGLVITVAAYSASPARTSGALAGGASSALRGANVFGWGFNNPSAVADDGTHIWVANDGQPASVIELSASTGALVRVISGDGVFNRPNAIISNGTDVWVESGYGSYITELRASDGSVLQQIGASRSWFDYGTPTAMTLDGGMLWVADAQGDAVTEINATTGALINTFSGFNDPDAITSSGSHVWVANINSAFRLDSFDRGHHQDAHRPEVRLRLL